MLKNIHNPDILTCLANLSNDEVFTPPNVVNQILDNLPKNLWNDDSVKFLDPVSKTGVFLREITRRLIKGLEKKYPVLEKRIEHILKNQVFGIGITQLTAELTRRTLYCSKKANAIYSIVNFDNEDGNIKFFDSNHEWIGVNKILYDKSNEFESYAYSFIHNNSEDFFKMKFDVIIGNPPYQMATGGSGPQATAIYNKFVEQAKKLKPRYLSMIIPARWYSGGFGLNEFRHEMLEDKRIRKLVDFTDPAECFPGIDLKGGVCYFLWDRDNPGECEITNSLFNKKETMKRYLKEVNSETFIRYNSSISIYRKVLKDNFTSFISLVSSQKPFGLPTNYNISQKKNSNSVLIYGNKKQGYIDRNDIPQNNEMINKYKIFISAGYGAGEGFPHQILNKPFIGQPNSCCTETYITIGPFSDEDEAKYALSYIHTKFFRFMVMLIKNSQHALKKVYSYVPMQKFDQFWTDEKLYKMYNLNSAEIEFIDKTIRTM